jgi:hypothetical protein
VHCNYWRGQAVSVELRSFRPLDNVLYQDKHVFAISSPHKTVLFQGLLQRNTTWAYKSACAVDTGGERLVKVAAISTNRYEPPDGHRGVTLAHSQTLWPSAFS